MSRINNNNNVQQQKPQPKSTRPPQDQAQKAGQESFASRFQKQDGKKKVGSDSPRPSTNQQATSNAGQSSLTSSTKTEGDPSAMMMQRHGAPVMSRGGSGGTVADLQAKLQGSLEGKSGKLEGGDTTGSLTGTDTALAGTEGAKGQDGQKGLIDTDNLKSDDMTLDNDAAGAAGTQLAGQSHGKLQVGESVQVKGNRIPVEVMDKIVDQARVGVNASGAAEFQFDLKGDVLGGLKMRMSMEEGQLKAIFIAENPEVKKLIDGNLKDLQKNLEDRGIFIKDLEVRDPEEDRRERQKQQNQKDREDAMDQ